MESKPNYSVTSEKEDVNNAVDLQSMRDVLRSKNENIFKQIPEIIDSVIKTIKIKISDMVLLSSLLVNGLSKLILSGYFGSLAFLFLKAFTEFIGSCASSKKNADQNAINWYSYFTLICVIITNFALEFFGQRGLSYFHAVYVVPINQSILIVMGTVMCGLYFQEFNNMNLKNGILFIIAILMTVIGVFISAFNSGNVSEKTDAKISKINHAITLSFDTNQRNKPDGNIPSILQLSPSLPITRNMKDEIPDLPPPAIVGTIARIHGLHRSMASMHFSKDGKPFYLDKNNNKLSVLSVIGVSSMITIPNIPSSKKQTSNSNEKKRPPPTKHIKHSQSLPTYSNSSLDVIVAPPNQLEFIFIGIKGITFGTLTTSAGSGNSHGLGHGGKGLRHGGKGLRHMIWKVMDMF